MRELFRSGEWPETVILVTRTFVHRCVMALSMYCRAPVEGILAFFDLVIGQHISKGTIWRIRSEAVSKAKEFDEQISLKGIREIAVDEIFQNDQPILTVVDLESGYAPIICPAEDRSGETWQQTLKQYEERGLSPELSINDGGSGLLCGLKKTYPEVVIQPDIFHLLQELGKEVRKADKMAVSKLSTYCQMQYQIAHNKSYFKKNGWKNYWTLREEIDPLLQRVDSLNILYAWIKESISFTGYGYEKNLHLCEWILDEMAILFPERVRLRNAISRFRKSLPDVLSFLYRLQKEMDKMAEKFHVTGHDFMLLYQQQVYPYTSQEYQFAGKRLFQQFGKSLPDAQAALKKMKCSVHRASSCVENLNGRIRCFINLKRNVPAYFFILVKVFFNTKWQFRSRCREREKTSAIERLTGQKHPEFLDIVSYPMNYLLKI